MELSTSIDSLTWSDVSFTLNTFLDKFGVPNLVCVKEGYYGVKESCSFETDQLLMLHTIRIKHQLIGKDSIGRAIALPLDSQNLLLVCPLSIHCRYEQIFVAQMPEVYPNINYFRVLENKWDKRRYLIPGSILQVKRIHSTSVEFEDVEQCLPFSCPIVFEPLLDYREYTLKEATKLFGLPAKVRFLSTRNAKDFNNDKNEFEHFISELGKVTVLHNEEPEEVVVVTKIDGDSLNSVQTSSMNCCQIPKDFNLAVYAATSCFKNDTSYVNIVRELDRAFLHTYDLKELDKLDLYEYIDFPNGSRKGTLGSVLGSTLDECDNLAPELPPKNRGAGPPPVPLPKPARSRYRPTRPIIENADTKDDYEECTPMGYENQDDHDYESIDTGDYEIVDESNYWIISSSEYEYCPVNSSRYLTCPDDILHSIPQSRSGDRLNFRANPPNVPAWSSKDDYLPMNECAYVTSPDSVLPSILQRRGDNSLKSRCQSSPDILTLTQEEDEYFPMNSRRYPTITSPDAISASVPLNRSDDDLNARDKSTIKHALPADLSVLSVSDVGRMLTSLNMECYAGKFREEQIDGEILIELDETALRSLDLIPFHVRKLMKVINGWRPNITINKL